MLIGKPQFYIKHWFIFVSVLKKKTLINFHFFNQSEAVILGLRMNKVTWHNFGRGPFKFGPIWFSSSWEVQNVKQQTADAKWWEELEWAFRETNIPKLCHVTLFILNPRMTASDWLKKWKFIKVFFLRTTGWNGTKFVQTSPWVVPIQNYIHRYCQLFKMTPMADCATLVLQHYLKCLEAVVVAIIWYLDL
jgi:hypothetical protein